MKNKHGCIGEVLNYLGLLTQKDMKRIIKNAFHEESPPIDDAYIEKSFEFGAWNYNH